MTILSKILYISYRFKILRKTVLSFAKKSENGEFYSSTLRKIFRDYHKVDVGMYSYGCFKIPEFGPTTIIGRYCSFAEGVCIFRANHPLTHKSLHPFFYNPRLGIVNNEKIIRKLIVIGHDVWIGQNAIITPSVNRIGNGAVIGAGAVVTKDVPDFAVVAGNPAKVIKYRFDSETINKINQAQWWLKDIKELTKSVAEFTQPFCPPSTDDIK
jgi:acetyltransferase-like isoleucine patch superfamily enzyme